jgi:hypothetical protein
MVEVVEQSGYRLERNLIMDISAAPNTSFVSFTEASEFTQFSSYVTPIISDYHISLKEFLNRSDAPWPTPTDETVIVPPVVAWAAPVAGPAPDDDEAPADWDDRLRQLGESSAKQNNHGFPPGEKT